MQFYATSLVVLAVLSAVFAEVYFEEKFQDGQYIEKKTILLSLAIILLLV